MIRIIQILFGLTCSLSVNAQRSCDFNIDTARILLNENLDVFLAKIRQDTFSISYDKKDIPFFIQKELDCWANNFTIANPNKPFNATDIYEKKLPDRQLFFVGVSKELFIMTYVRGGFTQQTHILFVEFKGKKIIDVWKGIALRDLKSKSEVLDYIKSRRDKGWAVNTNIIHF